MTDELRSDLVLALGNQPELCEFAAITHVVDTIMPIIDAAVRDAKRAAVQELADRAWNDANEADGQGHVAEAEILAAVGGWLDMITQEADGD